MGVKNDDHSDSDHQVISDDEDSSDDDEEIDDHEADGEAGQVAYLIEGLDDVQILPFYAKELEPRNPIPRKGDEVEPPAGLHTAQSSMRPQ